MTYDDRVLTEIPVLTRWWDALELPPQGYASLQLGPLHLLLSRSKGVLQLATRADGDALDERLERGVVSAWQPPAGYDVQRFALGDGPLRLQPRLPDRFAVARPERPTTVPAGVTLTAYLTVPVWVAVLDGETTLTEIPVYRPSDTWFGPSTMEGELGYALRTSLKTSYKRLHLRPHRAVTRLTIVNRGSTPLAISRLRLPMDELSLHAGQTALWTEELRIVRKQDDDTAEVTIPGSLPDEAGPLVKVAGARHASDGALLLRVFNSLFAGNGR